MNATEFLQRLEGMVRSEQPGGVKDQPPVKTWDRYFLDLCELVATRSKDRSTRVGCVIVGPAPGYEIRSTGYNSFPRGCDDQRPEWHERPLKYLVTEHAERNAIYNACRHGAALEGCTLYVPWRPCTECARGIVQVGIAAVVLDPEYPVLEGQHDRWREDMDTAELVLAECGVTVRMGV